MAIYINGTQQGGGGGGSSFSTLAQLNALITDLIPTYGGVRDIGVGTLAQRPTAGTSNRFFYTTDENKLYRDTGATWVQLAADALGSTPYQEFHEVTAGDVSAGYFTLTNSPATPLAVAVYKLNGVDQLHKQTIGVAGTPDFDVLNTNEIHINNNGAATGLSGAIVAGEKLVIKYTGA